MYLRFGRQPPLLLHDVSITLDVLLGHDLLDVVEFVQLHKIQKIKVKFKFYFNINCVKYTSSSAGTLKNSKQYKLYKSSFSLILSRKCVKNTSFSAITLFRI